MTEPTPTENTTGIQRTAIAGWSILAMIVKPELKIRIGRRWEKLETRLRERKEEKGELGVGPKVQLCPG
jgi:hypothetical protein